MSIRDYRGIKASALEALSVAPNHKKLVLLSTGAAAVLSLTTTVLSFILEGQIADTGGLAGLGMRSILSTIQFILSMATAALLPFWNQGFTSAALKLSRKQPTDHSTLLDGFRRFGPVLRLLLLKEILLILLISGCMYLGISVLSFTPLAFPFYDALSQTDAMNTGIMDDATLATLGNAMLPMLLGCAVLCLVVTIPLFYRLRLAELRIMDDPTCGAIAATLESGRLMRHNCLALFRLDLSFWWFYLADLLIAVLCYGDMILPALGITLPFSANVAYFVFYIIGLLSQVLLHWYARSYVSVSYARFYDTLRPPQTSAD
jgi:uncharacterized membrane protein